MRNYRGTLVDEDITSRTEAQPGSQVMTPHGIYLDLQHTDMEGRVIPVGGTLDDLEDAAVELVDGLVLQVYDMDALDGVRDDLIGLARATWDPDERRWVFEVVAGRSDGSRRPASAKRTRRATPSGKRGIPDHEPPGHEASGRSGRRGTRGCGIPAGPRPDPPHIGRILAMMRDGYMLPSDESAMSSTRRRRDRIAQGSGAGYSGTRMRPAATATAVPAMRHSTARPSSVSTVPSMRLGRRISRPCSTTYALSPSAGT